MKRYFILILLGVAISCGSNKKDSGNTDTNTDIPIITPDFSIGDQGPIQGCTSDKDCPAEKRICEPVLHQCVACINDGDCPKGYCVDNECLDKPCKPNTKTCSNTGKARICNADGTKYQEDDCLAKGLECYAGACVTCVPGELSCKNNAALKCKADASGWNKTPCGKLQCVEGKCVMCAPGARKCQGEVVMQCNADGAGFTPFKDCKSSETGKICHVGQCIDLCKVNAKFTTNLGCEYWPVDLQQPPPQSNGNGGTMDPANAPFAVVVGNTSKTITAKITVYRAGQKFKELTALPGKATIINLPPYNVDGSMLGTRAWRIVSNLPVVVYQFNPLANVDVFSNDASMLMPTNALGREYMVVAYPQPYTNFGSASGTKIAPSAFVTVVGVSKKPTTVKVTPTVKIMAGKGVQALSPGRTYQFTVKQYQVLNLNTNQAGGDLTGTIITSDHAVAVYAGNMCETVPMETCVSGRCTYEKDYIPCTTSSDCPVVMACDHLEQQIFPLKAVGKEYVISKSWARGKAPDLIRVVAVEDGTSVQVSPMVAHIPMLNKGQHFDFEISSDVHLTANKPVMVAQFLEGQDAPGWFSMSCQSKTKTCVGVGRKTCFLNCANNPPGVPSGLISSCQFIPHYKVSLCVYFGGTCNDNTDCMPGDANIGDPTFILGVPVEQYRKKYVFLVPTKYADNYINIIAKQGATVTLDNITYAPNQFTPIQGSNYMVSKRKIQEGSHYITSSQPMGIIVYGWDMYVSYGYPGGMNIEAIYSH